MNATTLPAAWSAAPALEDRWESIYPKTVACLRADLHDQLTFFRYRTLEARKAARTTNAIERRFREVRRRTFQAAPRKVSYSPCASCFCPWSAPGGHMMRSDGADEPI